MKPALTGSNFSLRFLCKINIFSPFTILDSRILSELNPVFANFCMIFA